MAKSASPRNSIKQLPAVQIDIQDRRYAVRAGGVECGDGPFEPRQVARHYGCIFDVRNRKPIGGKRKIMVILADDETFSPPINDDRRGRR